MNKARVKDLQKRIDQLEKQVDDLTQALLRERRGGCTSPLPAALHRRTERLTNRDGATSRGTE